MNFECLKSFLALHPRFSNSASAPLVAWSCRNLSISSVSDIELMRNLDSMVDPLIDLEGKGGALKLSK